MAALTPRLPPLDERVLAAVPEDGSAVRVGDVAGLVFGVSHLQRVGLLRCGRGGWWRRA